MQEIWKALMAYLQNPQNRDQLLREAFIILLISMPLSLLIYLVFNKYKQVLLVDLGHHKWLIK